SPLEKVRKRGELFRQIFDGAVELSPPIRSLAIRAGKVHGREFPRYVINLRDGDKRRSTAEKTMRCSDDPRINRGIQVHGNSELLALEKAEQGMLIRSPTCHRGRGLFGCHETER